MLRINDSITLIFVDGTCQRPTLDDETLNEVYLESVMITMWQNENSFF